jgi:hypothetical protein
MELLKTVNKLKGVLPRPLEIADEEIEFGRASQP